jgi:hypothetical protein
MANSTSLIEARERLAESCWVITAIVAAFLCFTQAGVMLSLFAGRIGMAAVAPLSVIFALFLGDRLAQNAELAGSERLRCAGVALGLIAATIAVSAWYFDLSWDGEWYHQTAIYAIARDWNPSADPTREFLPHLQLWVRHYAKGTWYAAAAIYSTTGHIEWGKCPTLLADLAAGLAVFAANLDWKLRRREAAAISLLAALNPVIMSELTTYLVDGVMVGFLVVVAAVVFSGLRRPRPAVVWTGMLSAIVCINAKLTGLVFLCFVFAAGWIWCAVRRRQWLLRYTAVTALALFLGAVVFGYNPYVTNTIHWHHPFYPVLGTKAFPSLTDQGKEGIELYETPKNMMGRSRFVRLAYATFGRPGNAPYFNQKNAEWMWPFTARPADLFYYRYHETRISGFGPFFSGALILAFALGVWLLFQAGAARWALLLSASAVVSSLLISLHLWWPRYGPQLWLLPILPVVFVFGLAARPRRVTWAAWTLVGLLAVNAGIVAAIRIGWETQASWTLRQQLTELRGKQIDVALGYFQIPVGERLKDWDVKFNLKGRRELRDGKVLMSVVEGYPGAVRYRVVQ